MSKRKDLPLRLQVEVLTKLNAGQKQQQIAQEFCVSQSQISRIKQNQETILYEFLENGNLNRRRKRKGQEKALEIAIYEWFREERIQGTIVTGPVVKAKAEQIAQQLGISKFKASKGWLYRWQLRHNVSFRTNKRTDDTVQSTRSVDVDNVMTELKDVMSNFEMRNVFFCDETCLLYRAVLSRQHDILGANHADKVTVLLCANQDGSSPLPPVLIGRCSEPACLKGVKKYPVLYTNSTGACMTSSIFHGWLQQIDLEMVKEGRKVALLVDNIAHHRIPNLHLKNIRLVFFPYHVRPLEDIIKRFKLLYRDLLLREMQVATSGPHEWEDYLMSVSLLRAMHFIREAWANVGASAIRTCFQKLTRLVLYLDVEDDDDDDDDAAAGDSGDSNGATAAAGLLAAGNATTSTALAAMSEPVLPFGLKPSDLREIDQLECKLELEANNMTGDYVRAAETSQNTDYQQGLDVVRCPEIDDSEKTIPPSKRQMFEALQVVRRFYDCNGYDASAVYTLQQDMFKHTWLPSPAPNHAIPVPPQTVPPPPLNAMSGPQHIVHL